jgi:hypothetical protein
MAVDSFTDAELLAYLDEQLPSDRAACVERALRVSAAERQRVTLLARRRDQGGHSVGEIWRRRRLSCLTRGQLGSYLLGILEPELTTYIEFHLQTVGCRVCAANLQDLQTSRGTESESHQRRRRFFESSAGLLRTR